MKRLFILATITLLTINYALANKVIEKKWPNGKLKKQYTVDDKRRTQGVTKHWYKNGNMKQEVTYVDGYMEGPYTTWYKGGEKKETGSNKRNRLHGPATFWYKNGKKKSDIIYENGFMNGPFTKWNKEGIKLLTGTYKREIG